MEEEKEPMNKGKVVGIILLVIAIFLMIGAPLIGSIISNNTKHDLVERDDTTFKETEVLDEPIPTEQTTSDTTTETANTSNNNSYAKEHGYNIEPEKEVNIDISNEEEVLTLGDRLWKYAYGAYWGTDDVWKRHRSEEPNELGAHYYVCDVTLESVKKKFTEDATFSMETRQSSFQIEEFLPSYGEECHGAGRGGLQDYKTTTLKIDKIEENEITYIATSEFCNGSFCQNSDDPERQKTVKTVEKPFVIKKVNDEWLIHKYYLPN